MTVFSKSRQTPDEVDVSVAENATATENKKETSAVVIKDETLEERPSEDAQHGVQDVQAVTLVWSKASLISVFILIWLLYFVNAFQSTLLSNLIPYVTSDFETQSLLNVISIVANAMSAASYIPLAKILDTWGRAEGFLFMAICSTLGLVLMAACNNLPTFCAAYVFYTIGFGGITYCVDVITADASTLKNRGLAYAFTSSPYIITAFGASKAAEEFAGNWRWAFGGFAIIFPVVAAPLFVILKYNLRKAEKQGILVRQKSGRTLMQSTWYYFKEFDATGVVLFSCGLTVFLLPFTLAYSAPDGWSSGYIIAMIVVGFVVLLVFGLFEWFLAPVPMLRYKLLNNRTVIGACLLDTTYQISYYCWDNYFTSFLQVVNDLSVSEAGYVNNTFNVVSGVLLLGVGFAIRRTGRFKWLLYIAVPLYVFAQGLMIYFRKPTGYIGYIVMCQIFISIGGSVFIIIQQLAVLAAVTHQDVAAALSLLYVVGTTGGAVGSAISGAIWTNTFAKALERYLPEAAMANFDMIYNDLNTQLSYAVGTPTRLAIQYAYGYAQTRMLAAGCGIIALAFFWSAMIENIDVSKNPQVKGMVF
ncbi:siderophore iron transporter 1 [Trichomonascus vanleenenianus]|uniref:siderophore iron transporter 1 n=1 Tax=Trichomonascus vanleenenianus TaxID=2268995 RepID=UPI003ECB83B6